MNETNLQNLDLNLLKALRVLVEELHVGRAAERMQVSQSAMSHTLARLRRFFDDPLFVRTARGLAPTPRTEAISERLGAILEELNELVTSPQFEPTKASGRITIQTNDFIAAAYLPTILGRINHLAPNLEMVIRGEVDQVFENLESGNSDLAIGVLPDTPPRFLRRRLIEDRYCCVLRQGHPAAQNLTLAKYLELTHGVVSLIRRKDHPVDLRLRELDLPSRRIGLHVESFFSLAYLLAHNDFIATLPHKLAEQIAGPANLVILDLPFEMQPLTIFTVWHERFQHAHRHRWLRSLIREGTDEKISLSSTAVNLRDVAAGFGNAEGSHP
ncbi:MAG: LysR family transcriptional regulator [Desulfuromonadales bacterium]|nr:LysR family transcriptional regulator [Desulfuromonadales bacterium]